MIKEIIEGFVLYNLVKVMKKSTGPNKCIYILEIKKGSSYQWKYFGVQAAVDQEFQIGD